MSSPQLSWRVYAMDYYWHLIFIIWTITWRMKIFLWSYLRNIKTPGCNEHEFDLLFKVAEVIMTIPHSNAGEERIFSFINKNKTPSRSSLSLDGTLSSLITIETHFNVMFVCFFNQLYLSHYQLRYEFERSAKDTRHQWPVVAHSIVRWLFSCTYINSIVLNTYLCFFPFFYRYIWNIVFNLSSLGFGALMAAL